MAEYVRTLDQREFNPLAEHIGRTFRREDVPPLYGHTFNPGNWNSGHVSLGEDVVLFITLHKTAGVEGADYDDRLDGPGVLVWSSPNLLPPSATAACPPAGPRSAQARRSQTSTGPETKRGREVLEAPAEGRRIHVWVRRRKADVAFEYRGLAVPLGDLDFDVLQGMMATLGMHRPVLVCVGLSRPFAVDGEEPVRWTMANTLWPDRPSSATG